MKSIIQFQISKDDNYYTANGVDLPIITQAKTLDELTENIKEAVDLHLEGEDTSELNLVSKPSVLINFELPKVYA
jgi:predicted RNase H-like HicB family nuclease